MNYIEILEKISWLLALLTSICYFYQFVYLIVPFFGKHKARETPVRRRYAILIAARNEEAVLPHLLASIAAQDYPADLITTYVVADNCTDRTAEIAEKAGAKVFVRHNRKEIGKGYALHFLLEQIKASGTYENFDAFLIFDADNLLQPNYITEMNKICAEGYEAFCGYRNTKNFGSSWVSAGYALWYLHDAAHLNHSRMRLGTTCAVSGTGFGFTRGLLERCGGWNFFTLTEDIEFNTWCATRGVRIGYCRDAILYDEQPITFRTSWRQRTRWTQGGLQVSFRYAKDLFRGVFVQRKLRIKYASFEAATLGVYGYSLSTVAYVFALLTIALSRGLAGAGEFLLTSLVTVYASMFALGLLTTITEWKRIHASTAKKIASLFTFPFFMMSFAPITATALFRKFEWKPIAHTVAIPVSQLVK